MKSRAFTVEEVTYLRFKCAGCDLPHDIPVKRLEGARGVRWDWNNNEEAPTLTPSCKTVWNYGSPPRGSICHFTLTDGVQQFHADDTSKPNQLLPLPELVE